MTQYKTLNVNLSNSQFNKSKLRIKTDTEVILQLSSNFVGNWNDKINFSHKLLLTNSQVSKIRKIFAIGSLANKELWKTSSSKMTKLEEFLSFIFTFAKNPGKVMFGESFNYK